MYKLKYIDKINQIQIYKYDKLNIIKLILEIRAN